VDRDNAWVLEARSDQRFAKEADLVHVAARDQFLDGDISAELAIVGARDAAEAAAAMFVEDLVAVWIADLRPRDGMLHL
jgi:hypothetical protein